MRRFTPPTSAAFAALLALACSGTQNEIRKLQPDLAVVGTDGSPDLVDLGDVVIPYTAETTFQVLNAGKATLKVTDIRVEGDDAGVYSLDLTELEVAPDEAATVTVGFVPATYLAYDTTLVIESNDPENAVYELSLMGEGVDGPVPDIALSSGSIDFGTVAPSATATEFVQILNVGDGPLVIDRIEQTGSGAFSIEAGPRTGGEIAGGGDTSLIVGYTPGADSGDSAVFTIYSNDPDESEVDLIVVGNGGSDDEYPVAEIDCPAPGDVNPPVRVTLDGTASYDPGGLEPLTYTWSLVERPGGSVTGLGSTIESATTLFVDTAGDWEVELRVTNTAGLISAPDVCRFFAEPQEQVHIELSWDTSNTDLDLHLIQGGSVYFDSQGDCCWCNRNPNWGTSSSADDPLLTLDDQAGYGPENTKIQEPGAGDYVVKVHYFEDRGGGTTTATVRVWLGGGTSPFWEGSKVLTQNQVWDVGVVRWPDATFAEYNVDPYRSERTSCRTSAAP